MEYFVLGRDASNHRIIEVYATKEEAVRTAKVLREHYTIRVICGYEINVKK